MYDNKTIYKVYLGIFYFITLLLTAMFIIHFIEIFRAEDIFRGIQIQSTLCWGMFAVLSWAFSLFMTRKFNIRVV